MTFAWSYVTDALQIAILYAAFYGILKSARGSRFGQVLTGVGILFGVAIAFTYLLHFAVLARLLSYLLGYLAISSVVIFQPEIRRILAAIGSFVFAGDRTAFDERGRVTPEKFTDMIFALSRRRLGALFAFERAISLRGYEQSGVALDAILSEQLLVSVFTEPLPLHDGGCVIRGGRLAAAHCVFPVSNQESLSSSGMRHRAAVGMSEETDALVIVISEETGAVAVAKGGHILRYRDTGPDARAAVLRWVRKAMPVKKTRFEQFAEWLERRRRRLLDLAKTANDRKQEPAA